MRCVEELTGKMDTSIEKKYGEIKTGYTPILEGDLLFAKITPCIENGKIAIAKNLKNGIGFASTEFHTLKFFQKNETKFYFFYLVQEKIRQEAARNMTGTAGQQRVPVTFLKRLKVPVPPLHIQRQIVAVLEKAEAVKRQRREADALTGALLQSVFREMFGDPVRNERGWEEKSLVQIVSTKSHSIKRGPFGSAIKKDCFVKTGYKIYEQQNVLNNDFNRGKYFIDEKKFNELKDFQLLPRDILITCSGTGTVGKIAIVPEKIQKGIINQALLKLTLDENKVESIFFTHLFSFKFHDSKSKNIHGSAIPNIASLSELKRIKFPIPPLALQQQFARIVQDVERIRERQVASGRQIEGLCEGLMARAFAGELVT